jgi:uncharacterized damage-inducible protein DinB
MTTESTPLTAEFVTYAGTKLAESLEQIARCVNLLSLDQVWQRPNEVSNSIGNLVLHLNGNVRQWIVAGLGGEAFHRDRPAEFAQREAIAKDVILNDLRQTVDRASSVMAALTPERLGQRVTIQGYDVSGLAAVFHVVEHFSLHTGQIVYATKLALNRDLSLYDPQGQRIDGRNSGTP